MKYPGRWLRFAMAALLGLCVRPAVAAEYPAPQEGDWVAPEFKFHTGEQISQLRLHYATIGNSAGEPVLILHGTSGSGKSMLLRTVLGIQPILGRTLDPGDTITLQHVQLSSLHASDFILS